MKAAILRGSGVLFLAKVLTLFLGFLQYVLIADRFGAGASADAYFVAYSIFFMLVSGMEGTFASTFIPIFVEQRERGGDAEAWRLVRSLFYTLLVAGCVLTMVLLVLAPAVAYVLAPGLPPEARVVCASILRCLSPLVALLPLNALLTSVYYCDQRFVLSAVSAVLPLAGGLTALVLFADPHGITVLPLGLTAFSVLQLCLLLGGLGAGIRRLVPVALFLHPGARTMFRLAPPRFLGLSLMRLDLVVDRCFASMLGVGFVTAISFGGKLPSMTAGTISAPLLKGMIPFLSKLTAREETEALRRILVEGLRAVTVILLPAGVFLVLFRHEIIDLLFQHGAFTGEATRWTAYPLLLYSLGLVFYGLNPLLRGTFFALKDTVTPLKIGLAASLLNVVLDLVLVRYLRHGGIALATSLVAGLSSVALVVLLQRRVGSLSPTGALRAMTRPGIAAAGMGCVLVLLHRGLLGRLPLTDPVVMTALVGTGAVSYPLLCALLKVRIFAWRDEGLMRSGGERSPQGGG